MYLPNKNIIIEFFGDYWHCNPLVYNENYYNKLLHKTAKERWEYDNNRLNSLLKISNNLKIIVIWEKSFKQITKENLII